MKKLSKLRALKLSSKHWLEDIIRPLEGGRMIGRTKTLDLPVWSDTFSHVPCYAPACALCIRYGEEGWWRNLRMEPCYNKEENEFCPLLSVNKEYNYCSPVWQRFIREPTLENARAMRDEIEKWIFFVTTPICKRRDYDL